MRQTVAKVALPVSEAIMIEAKFLLASEEFYCSCCFLNCGDIYKRLGLEIFLLSIHRGGVLLVWFTRGAQELPVLTLPLFMGTPNAAENGPPLIIGFGLSLNWIITRSATFMVSATAPDAEQQPGSFLAPHVQSFLDCGHENSSREQWRTRDV